LLLVAYYLLILPYYIPGQGRALPFIGDGRWRARTEARRAASWSVNNSTH
jgi:hypothetical protein